LFIRRQFFMGLRPLRAVRESAAQAAASAPQPITRVMARLRFELKEPALQEAINRRVRRCRCGSGAGEPHE
jgi:hypothetical protein